MGTQESQVVRPPNAGPGQLATLFAVDAHELIRLGIAVNKGAMFTSGAGVGGAAAIAAQGHWLIGLAVAAAGLVIGEGAKEIKRKKFMQARDKWIGVLSGLSESQLREFLQDVARFYPTLAPALREHALGGSVVRSFLESRKNDAIFSAM